MNLKIAFFLSTTLHVLDCNFLVRAHVYNYDCRCLNLSVYWLSRKYETFFGLFSGRDLAAYPHNKSIGNG